MRWNSNNEIPISLPLIPIDDLLLLQGEVVLHQRFTIHEQVQAEAPGTMYLAFDSVTHQPVMVRVLPLREKVLDATIAYTRHDIRRVGSAVRPDIVKMFDVDVVDNRVLIATELQGNSLSQQLSERQFTPDEALTCGLQVASALHYLHTHGVTYGVLTPATIDMTATNAARLSGIGLTHLVDSLAKPFPHDIVQRTSYVAPEEQRGLTPTPVTDIYHFGALLWEVILGSAPPAHMPTLSPLEERQIPEAVRNILLQCLQPQAEQRPAQLTQVIKEISAARRILRGIDPNNSTLHRSAVYKRNDTDQTPTVMIGDSNTAKRISVVNDAATAPRQPLFPQRETAQFAATQPIVSSQPLPALPSSDRSRSSYIAMDSISSLPENVPIAVSAKRQYTMYFGSFASSSSQLLTQFVKQLRPMNLRRRTLGGIALVTIVAITGVLYGTGIFQSAAAPIAVPSDDVHVQSPLTTIVSRPTPYHIMQSLVVNVGQTVRILPGVTLAFAPGVGIIVQGGTLDISGTATNHILLTAIDDSASGGGTGNSWVGIQSRVASGGIGGRIVLSNITIRYAGTPTSAAIDCQAGALTLMDSDQSDSDGVGLMAGQGCWGEVTRNTFERDNDKAAIIMNNALNFHDNTVLGSTVTLPS